MTGWCQQIWSSPKNCYDGRLSTFPILIRDLFPYCFLIWQKNLFKQIVWTKEWGLFSCVVFFLKGLNEWRKEKPNTGDGTGKSVLCESEVTEERNCHQSTGWFTCFQGNRELGLGSSLGFFFSPGTKSQLFLLLVLHGKLTMDYKDHIQVLRHLQIQISP